MDKTLHFDLFEDTILKYSHEAFLVSNLSNFIFARKFDKFGGTGLKYNNSFKFQSNITQKMHFWSQILHKTLRFDIFESDDLKYRDSFSNLQPKKNKIRYMFSRNTALWEIWDGWFQTFQPFFKVSVLKYSNKAFLVTNTRIFLSLYETLYFDKFGDVDLTYDIFFLQIQALTYA